MGEGEEAMPLPSSGDALGPSTVNSKLMGEQDGKLGDVKFSYSYKKQVEGKSPERNFPFLCQYLSQFHQHLCIGQVISQ